MTATAREATRYAPRGRRSSLVLLVSLLLTACGTGLIPGDVAMPNGSRQWIIDVDNQSGRDALLFVAVDAMEMGDVVGIADPPTVAAHTRRDVVFTVPPGELWAIFVNPSPQRGPLLLAVDVPPGVTGRLPISVAIDPNGEPSMSVPSMPGWMGD